MRLGKFTTLVILLALGLYIGLTLYFFGSSRPCGILEARMKPYRIKLETEAAFNIERKHSREGEQVKFQDSEILKLLEEDRKRIEEAPKAAMRKLHQELSELTPTECAVRAINWRRPE